MAGELVRYDAMCRAIDAAYTVDEIKDVRDKAVALEHYARQAKNKEAVRRCGQVRLRAERKAGQLLAERDKAKGRAGPGRGKAGQSAGPAFNGASTLGDLGISKAQSSQWQAVAAIPEPEFEAALGKVAIPTTSGLLKRPRREQRAAAMAQRTVEASRQIGRKLYSVIYADPPWRFEPYSRTTGMDRAADNHYPTMTLDAIKAMTIPAARDCVLFLWATAPMLPQALDVMQAWGFAYKSHCVWFKDRVGTGYWFRSQHELLLVGTRGSIPAPVPGDQYASVIEARVGAHSAKPNHFAEMIEHLFPDAPALELFARRPAARLGCMGERSGMMQLTNGVWRNDDRKFDLQLTQALVCERRLAEIFQHANFATVELKSERFLWEKSGNLCVEFSRNGLPSGIAVTQADVWVHELVDYRDESSLGYFLIPMPRMKALARRAYRERRIVANAGDRGEFAVALVPMAWLIDPGDDAP